MSLSVESKLNAIILTLSTKHGFSFPSEFIEEAREDEDACEAVGVEPMKEEEEKESTSSDPDSPYTPPIADDGSEMTPSESDPAA